MEDKSTVYLETTIAGYLTGRSSNDLVLAGKQEVTRQWWDDQRDGFRLVTSRFTVEEAARGDAAASARRLLILEECELLLIDSDVLELSQAIVATGIIPPKAIIDASHIATAARHGIDFLLTWKLRPYCKRKDPEAYRTSHCEMRLSTSRNLHTGRTL